MDADVNEMSDLIKPLGFSNKRSRGIIRMSEDYIRKDWEEPTELFGLGTYAQDSYDIFIRKRLDVENPADKFLNKYMEWAKQRL